MKVFFTGSVVVVSFVISILLISSAYGAEKTLKIGYVDIQKAVNESQTGQMAIKTMTDIMMAKQKSVEDKGKEIEKLKAEVEKQAAVLSPEAKKQKEEKLEKDWRDYQRMVRDSQEEVQKKEIELINPIIKGLRGIIKQIGEEEGYTIILQKADLILYSSPAYDLTEKVIKRYDQPQKK